MEQHPMRAEEIREVATKSGSCEEFFQKPVGQKWYFQSSILILAFLAVGPLALPLIWWHPGISRTKKVGITVAVLALTAALSVLVERSIRAMITYYGMLSNL